MQYTYNQAGFSIIELLVVIVIMGILAGLVVFLPLELRVTARDQERSADVAIISRRLEQAYTNQEIGKAAYPSTAEFSGDLSSKTRTGSRLVPDALMPPGASAAAVLMATSNSTTSPTSTSGQPTPLQYVYQPLDSSGAICTSSSMTCVKFVLYYRSEASNLLLNVRSFHQQ